MIHTEIDTSKLEPGMKVKNYKELCKLLGVPVKTSDSKKKQLREFEQYFKYHKYGREFIIDEIYETKVIKVEQPKPTDKRLKNPRNIYAKYVQLILCYYLTKEDSNGIIYMNKTDIYKMLGLINKSFGSYEAEKEFLEVFNHITMDDINVVKTQAYAKMNSILNKSLSSLRSKRLISYFTVVILEETSGKTRIASDEEIKKIDTIEHNILQEMGCTYIWEIYEKKIYHEFYQQVRREMRKFGWEKAQRKLKIIFTYEYILKEIENLDIQLNKIQLNEEFIKFLQQDIKNKHEAFNKKYVPPAFGTNSRYLEAIKRPENCLYIIPKEECIKKHELIAEAFIRYINTD